MNIFELLWFAFFAACVAAAATIGSAWLGWPGGVTGAALGVLLVLAILFYMNRSSMLEACDRICIVPCVLPEHDGLQQVLTGEGLTVSEPMSSNNSARCAERLLGGEASRLWRRCMDWNRAVQAFVVDGPNGESVFVCASEPESAPQGVHVLILLGSEPAIVDQIEKKLRALANSTTKQR